MYWMKLLEDPSVPEYIAFVDQHYSVARACQLKFEVFVALKVAVAFPIVVATDSTETGTATSYAAVVAEVGSAEIEIASNPSTAAEHAVAAVVAELLLLFVVAYAFVECWRHAAADFAVVAAAAAAVDLTYSPGSPNVVAGAMT
uniref:Uncharacterized protein n=1 Tax=Arundo donax TaxID=35708 RepID=A0A0A9CPA7_ARUDO